MGKSAGALSVALVLAAAAGWAFAEFKNAPEVRLSDLDGNQVTLTYAQSRLTLVNFWATWCLPCREEIPDIARLHSEFNQRGFRAVGVALESGGREEVMEFLRKHPEFGVNYTMLMGSDATIDDFGGIEIVPTTLLVDSEGAVVDTFLGVNPEFHKKVGKAIREFLDLPAKPEEPGGPGSNP